MEQYYLKGSLLSYQLLLKREAENQAIQEAKGQHLSLAPETIALYKCR